MERKRMSALSFYQSISTRNPQQTRAGAPPVKKIKRKENGVQTSKKKRANSRKSSNINLDQVNESISEREADDGGVHEQLSLEVLLTSLTKVSNSRDRAGRLFQWLLHPVLDKSFFRDNWEKRPILIQRKNADYYKGLFSTAEFDHILRNEDVQYGVNLDVTSYTNGKRETHNPPGRALPYTIWNFYESGCSLRMLNPQAFSSTVWHVLSILQEKFGSMAGANIYLTPPGTQGFAPHFDDIEAFVIQLEGKKHWRVYKPRSEGEVLSLVSSPNFSQGEIGQPLMDVVLEAGDLLYFPRGFVHQGNCLPDAHSLHITISSYQKNSWGDLMLKLMPAALEAAMEEDVEFRKGLPLEYLSYMGVQNSEKEDPRREKFMAHVQSLMKKLVGYAPVDAAVDQKAKDFLHDCLPPLLSAEEKALSVLGAPARWGNAQPLDVNAEMKNRTQIKLVRAGAARLCSDGDKVFLYYTTENSRVYHKEEPKSMEIKTEHIDGVEFLIHSYPRFVTVASLPCESVDAKISLAELLFERGVIITAEALTAE